jgi:hypothetical protein
MLTFLASVGHEYTVDRLLMPDVRELGLDVSVLAYESAFVQTSLPRATYLFTDFERMYPWELRLAARLYSALRAKGCKVLNNPARGMAKYQLLRTLHRAGINRFTTYRADDLPRPARFPVFIRMESDHAAMIHDLIPDAETLARTLARLVAGGLPLRGLLITEYCAEPIAPGLFRRFATFRIGDRFVPEGMVLQKTWAVKHGFSDPANAAYHPMELDFVKENRYLDTVRPAFDLAHLEYGRADIGVVEGQPQIYEINSSPNLKEIDFEKIPESRREAIRLSWGMRLEAFAELDVHRGETGMVEIEDDFLARHRRQRTRPDGIGPAVRP